MAEFGTMLGPMHTLLTEVSLDAGVQATVVVSGRDRFLNAIHQGGASLVATMRMFSATEAAGAPKESTMEAHDRGNGSYSVDCSLKQACDFEVCSLCVYPWLICTRTSYVMCSSSTTHSSHQRYMYGFNAGVWWLRDSCQGLKAQSVQR